MAASAVTPLLSNHQTPLRQQKGYSIIELSIALAIISIILVTALAGVQRILRSNNTNEDLKNINLLASKLTVMLSNVQTTAGIAQANLVNLRVFEGFRVNGNVVTNAFNGNITVAPNTAVLGTVPVNGGLMLYSAGNRVRKVMLFWTLLDICGFEVNPQRLQNRMESIGITHPFNPSFPQLLRMSAYQAIRNSPPPPLPTTFADMVTELSVVARFSQSYQNDPSLRRNGQFIFDSDEEIMISFMFPPIGYSPFVLRPCLQFHSPEAGDFVAEILYKLAQGETVILDLGSANEQIIRYFSRSLSEAVFREQESKFVANTLNNNFIQIYFEEAHMIFPPNAGNTIDVYSRFAKEGAKFNIGIVYSTQSPSTVNRDLLSQTENFFIGHLSSSIDTDQLAKIQQAFHNVGQIIMRQRTRGLLHVLTHSHRYVIPVQANRYNGISRLAEN